MLTNKPEPVDVDIIIIFIELSAFPVPGFRPWSWERLKKLISLRLH